MAKNERVILLVEDNDNDASLTLQSLRDSHVVNPVVVVRDGQEALDYLFGTGGYADRNPEETPALVLLDLNLPKIPGMEVLRRLREDPRTSLARVVLLTSSREEEDMLAGYQLGANSYVCKPVAFDQFAEAARRLGLYWLVINESLPEASS